MYTKVDRFVLCVHDWHGERLAPPWPLVRHTKKAIHADETMLKYVEVYIPPRAGISCRRIYLAARYSNELAWGVVNVVNDPSRE